MTSHRFQILWGIISLLLLVKITTFTWTVVILISYSSLSDVLDYFRIHLADCLAHCENKEEGKTYFSHPFALARTQPERRGRGRE